MNEDLSIFDRRMEIISVLNGCKQISRPELSRMFSVSLSAIYRDINAISRHVPISSNHGRYGGIFIPEDLKTKEQYLSYDEEQLIRHLADTSIGSDKALLQCVLHKFSMPR